MSAPSTCRKIDRRGLQFGARQNWRTSLKEQGLSEISPKPAIVTEVVIIGAGPCGLFQVFELGLLGMSCHVVDSLGAPGGQCTELYPDKPIYDIPALPVCGAQELVDRLLQQIVPFNAPLHLGQEVTALRRREDGRFDVETILGTRFDAGAVVIAGGVGSFQPRRLGVPGMRSLRGPEHSLPGARRRPVPRQETRHFRWRRFRARLGHRLRRQGRLDHPRAPARRIQGCAGLGGENARAGGRRSAAVHRRPGRLVAHRWRHSSRVSM